MNFTNGILRIGAVVIFVLVFIEIVSLAFRLCAIPFQPWYLMPLSMLFLSFVALFLRFVYPPWRQMHELLDFEKPMANKISIMITILLLIDWVMLVAAFYIYNRELENTDSFQVVEMTLYILFAGYTIIRLGLPPLLRWIIEGFNDGQKDTEKENGCEP